VRELPACLALGVFFLFEEVRLFDFTASGSVVDLLDYRTHPTGQRARRSYLVSGRPLAGISM